MRRNIAIVLLIILGCGPREAALVSVRGVVTLDGKPLPDGQISFITLGKVPNVIPIMDGRFEGEVPPGAKRVEIAAYCPAEIPPDQLGGGTDYGGNDEELSSSPLPRPEHTHCDNWRCTDGLAIFPDLEAVTFEQGYLSHAEHDLQLVLFGPDRHRDAARRGQG